MPYACDIAAYSINPYNEPLITFKITYPRFIHSELLTHRVYSRNSSSSRAIPLSKKIQQVMDDPVMPLVFGCKNATMQPGEEVDSVKKEHLLYQWLAARDEAVDRAKKMDATGLHKSYTNRIIEPFTWITVVLTGDQWTNFFNLRVHPDAAPEIQKIAEMMLRSMAAAIPRKLAWGDIHMPFITDEERGTHTSTDLARISISRCAQASYERSSSGYEKDMEIYERISKSSPPHLSPFEHAAIASTEARHHKSNFTGQWLQYRKMVPDENMSSFNNRVKTIWREVKEPIQ